MAITVKKAGAYADTAGVSVKRNGVYAAVAGLFVKGGGVYANALFSPASLFASGEQGVWYDPSDFSAMFQDSAGTAPVTAVGQPVGRITDKSGRGNHATQATAASRPLLQQDGAGKYYLAFDGADDWLSTAGINFAGTDKMTIFSGVRKLTDGGNQTVYELSSNGGGNVGSFFLRAPTGGASNYQSLFQGATGSNTATPAIAAPDTAVLTATADLATATCGLRRNGVFYPGAGDTGAGTFGNYPIYIGRRGVGDLPFNGRLYALIVRGAMSTAAQINAAEGYVNQRAGAY